VVLSLRAVRIVLFAVITAVIYATAVVVVSRLPRVARPDVLAVAVLLDLVAVVPLAYFLIFLRGKKRVIGLTPVFLLSLAGAALVLPAEYRALLPRARLLALPAELALVAYLVWSVRWAFRKLETAGNDHDVLEALSAGIAGVIPSKPLASALAYEIAVVYYALFSWFRRPPSNTAPAFSYHRRNGYSALVFALIMVSAVEIPGLHIVVHPWSAGAAWFLTALGLYAVLWIVGDFQGIRHRPIVVLKDGLRVRIGLRWSAFIPFSEITQIQSGKEAPPKRTAGYLRAVLLAEPQLLITLCNSVRAQGPYGLAREVTRVGVAVDDGDRLGAVLKERCGFGQAG
jgi:hypothetical protein